MKRAGFTLAEMLVALTLIGVIAAIILPKLLMNTGTRQDKARVATAAAAITQVAYAYDPYEPRTWVEQLSAGLNSKGSATLSHPVGTGGGCAAGNSTDLNKSAYITFRDGTVIALASTNPSGTVLQAMSGTISGYVVVGIAPSANVGSICYYGTIDVNNQGIGKTNWNNTISPLGSYLGAGNNSVPINNTLRLSQLIPNI